MQSLLNSPKVKSSLQMVKSWAPLWIGTTLLFGGLGTVYSMFLKKDLWLASQGILVRDEATGGQARQGRFGSQTELKAAQETILDMARNHQVVRNAFLAAGPEETMLGTPSNWPSNTDIKNFVDQSLSVHAPRGGEFGSTEVVYVDVKHTNAERALILNKCICDALDEYLKQVRETRAQSISDELTQTRDRARLELAKSTKRLQEIEKGAGSDLTDLRSLAEIGGGSNSRGVLEQLRLEIRQAESKHQELLSELEMLENAVADSKSFIVAPGALLNSQPGLKRLREGLVDAQLNASQLSSKFTDQHPNVISARSAIEEISQRLNLELQASLLNAKQSRMASEKAIQRLRDQEVQLEGRLEKLADSRAIYANIVSEVKTRAGILEKAERELAEAESMRISSQSTSLLSKVDEPNVSDKPIGPGRTIIMMGATAVGLFSGWGLMLLLHPLITSSSFGRRWNDAQGTGRRSSDRSVVATSQIQSRDAISSDYASRDRRSPISREQLVSREQPISKENSEIVSQLNGESGPVEEEVSVGHPTDHQMSHESEIERALNSLVRSGNSETEEVENVPSEEDKLASLLGLDLKAKERRQLPRKKPSTPLSDIAIGVRKTPS